LQFTNTTTSARKWARVLKRLGMQPLSNLFPALARFSVGKYVVVCDQFPGICVASDVQGWFFGQIRAIWVHNSAQLAQNPRPRIFDCIHSALDCV
jgi:hypothetical protein